MYNDLLKIGPVTIHGYGLMIGIGFLAALFVASRRAKKRGLDKERVYTLAILALVFGFLGAKILYCIIAFKTLISDPLLALSGGGFVLYGGVIGGIAAVMVYCRIKKIKFLAYFDLLAPSIAIAQGFGRIGCFLAGCCYGHETHGLFGITFEHSDFAPNGVSLIPTQLISSAGDFLIALALILFARREKKRGLIGATYLAMYSVGRFAVEFFRDDNRGSVGALSTSQFISIFILLAAVGMLFFIRRTESGDSTLVPDAGDDTGVIGVEVGDEKDGEAEENDGNNTDA